MLVLPSNANPAPALAVRPSSSRRFNDIRVLPTYLHVCRYDGLHGVLARASPEPALPTPQGTWRQATMAHPPPDRGEHEMNDGESFPQQWTPCCGYLGQ